MDDLVEKVEEIEKKQEEPSDATTPTSDTDIWSSNPDNLKLLKHFGVDVHESNWYQEKISEIYKWAKAKGNSSDIIDCLVEIRALQRHLGLGGNEKSVNEVYRWIRLDQEEDRIKKEKGTLHAI